MSEQAADQFLDVDLVDDYGWNDFAFEQGWSDGLPLYVPTEQAVERMIAGIGNQTEPFAPISPRQVVPSLETLAANAIMAGCKPEYFQVVLSALRAVSSPEYNLHGTLATTHSCASMILVNGPVRNEASINCASNCFGQGWRANASIGRALQLILRNVGGAMPGQTDRATQGNGAKLSYCFGENEEQSPWSPYHVRAGFAADESTVTVMAAEGPHNINDHASTSAEGLLTTMGSTISQSGANVITGKGPFLLVLGPEHAQTIARDGLSIEDVQNEIYQRSRVHVSRVSKENQRSYEQDRDCVPIDDHYYLCPSALDIHVLVAGGAGKHSAYIPSFGGTAVCTKRIAS